MNEQEVNARTNRAIRRSVRIYQRLLRLYPQTHRKEWGPWMVQLFRDQCRDAYQEGRAAGLCGVWLRVLPDLALTACREHVAEIKRRKNMNYIKARKSSLALLAAGAGAGVLSFSFYGGPWMARLAALSAVLIGAKAAVELFRPSAEWKWSLASAFVAMIFFGMFMPAWAKAGLVNGQWLPLNYFTMACVMANPLVALIKSGQFLMERRKR